MEAGFGIGVSGLAAGFGMVGFREYHLQNPETRNAIFYCCNMIAAIDGFIGRQGCRPALIAALWYNRCHDARSKGERGATGCQRRAGTGPGAQDS